MLRTIAVRTRWVPEEEITNDLFNRRGVPGGGLARNPGSFARLG
jgi:hypothetical protein